MCCFYFTVYRDVFNYTFTFLFFLFSWDTFGNVLVPASIWIWLVWQHSKNFTFKCCRLFHLPVRAIPIPADEAITWVTNAFNLVQDCLIIFKNFLLVTKTGCFVCHEGICSFHLKLVMRQIWITKIFYGQIAKYEAEM